MKKSESNLLTVPQEVLEMILEYLTYNDIANLRVICVDFDRVGKRILNRGFRLAELYHQKCHKEVKSHLPRRESERRDHPLAHHCSILSGIETRLSLLNMTYYKYIDADQCCFIPGKVIDEIFRVLRIVQHSKRLFVDGNISNDRRNESIRDFRANLILKELRDISSMAMEHFDEKILPTLKPSALPLSSLYAHQLVAHYSSSSTVPDSIKLSYDSPDSGKSESFGSQIERLGAPLKKNSILSTLKKQVSNLQKKHNVTRRKCNEQDQVIQELNRVTSEQNSKLNEQDAKLTEQKNKIVELNKIIMNSERKTNSFIDILLNNFRRNDKREVYADVFSNFVKEFSFDCDIKEKDNDSKEKHNFREKYDHDSNEKYYLKSCFISLENVEAVRPTKTIDSGSARTIRAAKKSVKNNTEKVSTRVKRTTKKAVKNPNTSQDIVNTTLKDTSQDTKGNASKCTGQDTEGIAPKSTSQVSNDTRRKRKPKLDIIDTKPASVSRCDRKKKVSQLNNGQETRIDSMKQLKNFRVDPNQEAKDSEIDSTQEINGVKMNNNEEAVKINNSGEEKANKIKGKITARNKLKRKMVDDPKFSKKRKL